MFFDKLKGGVPEWPNGADCKSAGSYLRWFESIRPHFLVTNRKLLESKQYFHCLNQPAGVAHLVER
jgi:hypothetical protein